MLSGEIPEEEMKKVFNLGIGYCVVYPKRHMMQRIILYKSWTIGEGAIIL